MNNREWDDEDTAGEPQSIVQLLVISDVADGYGLPAELIKPISDHC
jgi:hypothetical protein